MRTLGPAIGALRVATIAADVVLTIVLRIPRVERVRVQKVVVHGEVRIVDPHAPVLCREHPAPRFARPRVAYLLVPTIGEMVATVIVVAKDTKPLLTVEAGTAVDRLKDHRPLAGAMVLPRRRTTPNFDSAPVECISDIQNVVGIALGGPLDHLLRHLDLRRVVDAFDECASGAVEVRVVCWLQGGAVLGHRAAPIADDENVVPP
mmetsp:Transcript_19433/g.54820  ORF Transcript_19433/g.54820 Transcript_19433/m.54820 type:complete len:205 (-) Transcript_19433:213-827(-)